MILFAKPSLFEKNSSNKINFRLSASVILFFCGYYFIDAQDSSFYTPEQFLLNFIEKPEGISKS
jgi:hypothetical protein